jgi:hypothetical protein
MIKKIAGAAASKMKAGMQSNSGKSGFAGLPPIAKTVIVIVGAFVTYKIVKSVTTALSQTRLNADERDDKQEEQGWHQELINESQNKKPTLSKAQMKQVANKIENMLDGYGTRDQGIKDTFKKFIKNNADFAGVNAAFGVRTIEAGQGIGWMAGHERGTLTQCLQEADYSTLAYINKVMASRGIKYKV